MRAIELLPDASQKLQVLFVTRLFAARLQGSRLDATLSTQGSANTSARARSYFIQVLTISLSFQHQYILCETLLSTMAFLHYVEGRKSTTDIVANAVVPARRL